MRVSLIAGCAVALAACSDDSPPIDLPMTMTNMPPQRPCTPASAGIENATMLEYTYWDPPGDCVLDPEGRAGMCNVAGCNIGDALELVTSEAALSTHMGCSTPTPSGIDFTQRTAVFVRQGTRVGETMGERPVAWMVEQDDAIVFGESRRSFCTGGQPLTGGIISYVFTVPVRTASTSTVARHVCFRRVPCNCGSDEQCGE
jgi:hypothetical protein